MLDSNTIQQLEEKRQESIRNATEKLLQDNTPVEQVEKELKTAEMSSKILAAVRKKKSPFPYTLLFSPICLGIICLAATLNYPRTHIAFDLISSNVAFTLREKWDSADRFTAENIVVDHIANVSASGLNIHESIPEDQSGKLTLQGTRLIIDTLNLEQQAEVELSAENERLQFSVKGSPILMEVSAQQKLALELETQNADIQKDADAIPLEKMSIRTRETIEDPVTLALTLHAQEKWKLDNLQIENLGFYEEYPLRSGIFESVIQSGTLTVTETGKTIPLQQFDQLSLQELKNIHRLDISTVENGVRVVFEGTVKKLRAGPKGVEQNLTLSWLEYFYHQQKLVILWTAWIFISGITIAFQKWFMAVYAAFKN